jgi:ribosomal protein S18 acetylase RimI-like enzyme
VAAGCGTPDQQRREIETLHRIAAEARVRVGRIVARHGGGAVSIAPWDALAAETPKWLARGIRTAWRRRGRFHADVLAQSRAVLPNAPAAVALESYAEFLLEELPVLLHRYYFRPDEVVDVYPGPQPVVFWRIEAGAYADEMPDLAARLCPRAGLVYARVGARIRPMRVTEVEAVVRVWRRSREQVHPWREGRINGSADDDRRHFRDVVARQSEVWLAVEDGQILGFLALAGTQVSHLHVDPAAQRRGVGSALLERAKALSPGGLTVCTYQRDESARTFYSRRGFREVRRARRVPSECGPKVELAWEPGDGEGGPFSLRA